MKKIYNVGDVILCGPGMSGDPVEPWYGTVERTFDDANLCEVRPRILINNDIESVMDDEIYTVNPDEPYVQSDGSTIYPPMRHGAMERWADVDGERQCVESRNATEEGYHEWLRLFPKAHKEYQDQEDLAP